MLSNLTRSHPGREKGKNASFEDSGEGGTRRGERGERIEFAARRGKGGK